VFLEIIYEIFNKRFFKQKKRLENKNTLETQKNVAEIKENV